MILQIPFWPRWIKKVAPAQYNPSRMYLLKRSSQSTICGQKQWITLNHVTLTENTGQPMWVESKKTLCWDDWHYWTRFWTNRPCHPIYHTWRKCSSIAKIVAFQDLEGFWIWYVVIFWRASFQLLNMYCYVENRKEIWWGWRPKKRNHSLRLCQGYCGIGSSSRTYVAKIS